MKNIKRALKDTYEQELLSDISYAENQPYHEFSDEHNIKMDKIIGKRPKPVLAFLKNPVCGAACIAIVGFVVSVSVLQVEAIREPFMEKVALPIIEVITGKKGFVVTDEKKETTSEDNQQTEDDKYISYEEPGSDIIEAIETYYIPGSVPEGFEICNLSSRSDNYVFVITYRNGEELTFDNPEQTETEYWENKILFTQYLKQNYYDVSVGANNISEIVDNGITYTVIYYEKENVKCFLWEKDYYILHVNVPSTFTVEEGLQICRSVRAAGIEEIDDIYYNYNSFVIP